MTLAQAYEPARGRERERAAHGDDATALARRMSGGLRRFAIFAALAAVTSPIRLPRGAGIRIRPRGIFHRASVPRPAALLGFVLGGATIGVLLARRTRKRSIAAPLVLERSITIGKPADELYELLRRPDTLSRVIGPAAKLRSDGDGGTHWSVEGPLGRALDGDTRLVEERPSERLRWESTPGSKVHKAMSVGFRPAPEGWGTEVSLQLRLDVDGGALGALTKHLGPVPGAIAGKALHRYKSLAETGEVPTLDRQPAARKDGRDLEGGR